jgi:hypothetical protein
VIHFVLRGIFLLDHLFLAEFSNPGEDTLGYSPTLSTPSASALPAIILGKAQLCRITIALLGTRSFRAAIKIQTKDHRCNSEDFSASQFPSG